MHQPLLAENRNFAAVNPKKLLHPSLGLQYSQFGTRLLLTQKLQVSLMFHSGVGCALCYAPEKTLHDGCFSYSRRLFQIQHLGK